MKIKKNKNPIFVTEPSLAPLEDYVELLKGIWERKILTHNGPLVQKLEDEFKNKLSLNSFVAVSNGTIALQMAIKALEIKGEIITTPFTWVATISAIKWEGCTPVFADINHETLNINPDLIESKITEKTVAIMPVHVFGNPCEIDKIHKIANKYNLKVIYDAAHSIGSTYKNKSVLQFGDVSATSLHATKLINSGEGGGCVTNDQKIKNKLERIRFFGHNNKKDIVEDGFNGKMTEIHAALGIVNLKNYDLILKDRKNKYNYYLNNLSGIPNIKFQKINKKNTNYSYLPIIFENETQLLSSVSALNKENIYPRRYFYPSVNRFNQILDYSSCKISEDIANRILCLPLYHSLDLDSIRNICKTIKSNL